MAQIALNGNIVAVPKNYNERAFQMEIVGQMKKIPETVVIGSSRGMYLGKEITGYNDIYNNCVSGATIEDYYALLGLYKQKFSILPKRVIGEISPWVLYENNPNLRWGENMTYLEACKQLFLEVNGRELIRKNLKKENPFLSITYFQYNMDAFYKKGLSAFAGYEARISTDVTEQADLPDGTIRYPASLENASSERLKKVKTTSKGVTYQNVNKMKQIGNNQRQEFENLIGYLQSKNIEIIFYLQPFSVTQCKYIYEQNANPVFNVVEDYVIEFGKTHNIKVVGNYNANKFHLSDESFIDFMHLDKKGTQKVWNESLWLASQY
ncbi:MAG: hypothetical protein IJ601_11630 [Acidaminococcaceae bacterium]|nr:hypothetical protein [Acidaminococcaceae bacterium]